MRHIGSHAFYRCSSLRKIDLPNNLTAIYQYAFAKCVSLSNIKLTGKVKLFTSAFEACTSLKEVDLSDWKGEGKLCDCCFKDCTSLESIFIPKTVTELGKEVFYVYLHR